MKASRVYEGTNFITGLRAIAVLLVFLIHSGGGGLRDYGEVQAALVDFGKYGVPMFFVISGFTVFHQLFETDYSFRRFLAIRVLRISLAYYPVLFFVIAYYYAESNVWNDWAKILNGGEISGLNLLLHLTYLGWTDFRYANSIIGVEWSLNVEIFYYCMLGVLITCCVIRKTVGSASLLLCFWLLVAFVTLSLAYYDHLNSLTLQWAPFKYGWMFSLGGVAYILRSIIGKSLNIKSFNSISNIVIANVILAVTAMLCSSVFRSIDVLNETVFAGLTGLLIVFARDTSFLSALFTNRIFILIGSLSFSIYLWHYLIINSKIIESAFGSLEPFEKMLLDLSVTVIVAFVWFHVFENYCYKYSKNWINKIHSDRTLASSDKNTMSEERV